tara:strand:+ start:1126 stop:2304 length:1179 start_codon:yes stop_codon:yes gene_type:complete
MQKNSKKPNKKDFNIGARGVTTIEYAITLGLIGVVAIGATRSVGIEIEQLFTGVNSTLASHDVAGSGGSDDEDESGTTVAASCMDPSNVGTLGTESGCLGMLIVDRPTLYGATLHGDASYEIATADGTFTLEDDGMNIFTGQITDFADLFNNDSWSGDIGYWDVSNVTDFSGTFQGSQFAGSIAGWDVSSASNMDEMFRDFAGAWPNLAGWNVSSVTSMEGMFRGSDFDQNIGGWNVSSVQNFTQMFATTPFNQNIQSWDVSSATNMMMMFDMARQFNSDLSGWNVSNVTNMGGLFRNSSFNKDISSWDVSNVTQMWSTFSYAPFNRNIGNWDVSNVEAADYMFAYNSVFDQDLSGWCTPKIDPANGDEFLYDEETSASWTSDEKPVWGTCP